MHNTDKGKTLVVLDGDTTLPVNEGPSKTMGIRIPKYI